MQSCQLQLERAKTCIKNKRFDEAKQIILDVIQSQQYSHCDRLYCKLGDICLQSHQYTDAHHYYQQAIQQNPLNATACFKAGYLLHHYFDSTQLFAAQSWYQHCLKLAPKHEQCLFHYGVLLETQHDFESAKKLFLQCLAIDDKKACINYHLAKILMHENKSDNIEYLLHKAIQYQPRPTAKYHFEYALFLEAQTRYNQAKQQYLIALKCIDYSDADILYRYHRFLWHCMHQKQEALHYLAMAVRLNKQYETEYNELSTSINNNIQSCQPQSNKTCTKVLVYEFECTITYWNLSKTIDDDIGQLYEMRSKDLIGIFGGYDRIQRLQQHFAFVLDQHDTRLVIISFVSTDIVREALKRTDLLHYFALIIGTDTSPSLSQTQSKLDDIIKLKDKNKLFDSNEMLYIDSDPQHIEQLSTQCRTYHIDPAQSAPFLSMTRENMQEIECMLAQKEYNPQSAETDECTNALKEINGRLLDDIVEQVRVRTSRFNETIDDLPCIQYIARRIREKQTVYHRFMDFAIEYQRALQAIDRREWWTAAFILQKLTKITVHSVDIWRKYAKCVSYLRHLETAEFAYSQALELQPGDFWTTVSYAYHLFYAEQHAKAEPVFADALKIARGVAQKTTAYLGLARTLEYLEQPEKTEHFYQLAIADKADAGLLGDERKQRFYQTAYFGYASFLCSAERYDEARQQMEKCMQIKCNNAEQRPSNYHRKYAQILFKLGEHAQCEQHLEIAYEMDPYCPVTHEYMRRYLQPPADEKNSHEYVKENSCVESKGDRKSTASHEIISNGYKEMEEKETENARSCGQIQFEAFWVAQIGVEPAAFKMYYDRFVELGLDTFECVSNEAQIEFVLREKIKVTHPTHFKYLMAKIFGIPRGGTRIVYEPQPQ